MDLLLFRLYGPMASWGEIAVGESRHTADYPGKSALLGLLGAALGIERGDEAGQQALQQGYAFAVELISPGDFLRDFHTTQAPDSVGKFRYRTRRDEIVLGRARLGTILSSREYRSDHLALVAVRAVEQAPYDLREIGNRLLKPVFHLYLGRKSCPLAAPLDPQLLAGQANFPSGFKAYRHRPLLPSRQDPDDQLSESEREWLQVSGDRLYYWEGSAEDFSEGDPSRRQTRFRHDQPLSRGRWQFAAREEHFLFQGEE